MSCVYALVLESAQGDYRYIGRTSETPHRRLSKHRTAARTTDGAYLCRWIRKVWNEGETIKIVVLEDELTFEESGIREIALIKQYRDAGFRLTNISAGGDERLGNSRWKHTEESLVKMRGNNYRLGRKDGEETRKKKSLSAMGNKGRTGMKFSEESLDKMRGNTNSLGHKHSAETRAKMSASQMGRKRTPETQAKINATRTLNKLKKETESKA